MACRIPFGLGALITDAFLCYIEVSTLQKVLGGPPQLAQVLKAAEWLILASLAPFLLLLLAIMLLSGATGAVKTELTTGAWLRNEEFIARQKARGLLPGFGPKPPPLLGTIRNRAWRNPIDAQQMRGPGRIFSPEREKIL